MQPRSIEERVAMLDGQMQEMRDLPQRVTSLELQIVQLRQEMRDEFSATRAEFRSDLAQAVTTLRGETRDDLTQAVVTLRGEMATKDDLAQAVTMLRGETATLRGEMATKGELGQAVTTLREEIAGAVTTLTRAMADTNAQMRVLHEEALSRIATIGEGRRPGKKR